MENKFDGILSQMVQSHKGYEGFFDSVFGFLRRKTDFYQNAKQAEVICFKAADKHLKMYQKDKKSKDSKKQEELLRKQQREKKVNLDKQKKQQQAEKKKESQKPKNNLETSKKDEDKPAEGTIMPNKGNGSKTETYYWTQTLEELTINIPLPPNTKSKQLNVVINKKSILIELKDKSKTYIKGELYDNIHTDDTIWTLATNNNQRIMEITLTKWKGSMKWWDCVVLSETKIDCQKINPEPSKLGDLEGEMKGTVEKMMFDMRQKEKGLPSSDELQKQEKLKEFMKLHPEMDFSKAKFS